MQWRPLGAPRRRARPLPVPRRALLLRGRHGLRPGLGRRGGALDRARGARGAQRAPAADGEADAGPVTQPPPLHPRRAGGRRARRDHPAHPAHQRCSRRRHHRRRRGDELSATDDAAFEALLEFLRRSRGIDFTGYKRPSLQRRFDRRMETVGCQSFGDYLDYLEVHPDEYEQLFEMLLINVTEFFRDGPSWDHLRTAVLPALLAAKDPGDPVRVWSAGCAGGQEAYTAAMVFADLLGVEAFRERVKIYATDIDEDALNQARLGVYGPKETESVPPELRERYFERA